MGGRLVTLVLVGVYLGNLLYFCIIGIEVFIKKIILL